MVRLIAGGDFGSRNSAVDRANTIAEDYFFTPKTASFAAWATRNSTTVLGWNLDLLLPLWINARARLPLLLHQLAKTGQDKFAVLFNLFVSEHAGRIEEYSSGSFVGQDNAWKRPFWKCLEITG
jgi:hypothetical protein